MRWKASKTTARNVSACACRRPSGPRDRDEARGIERALFEERDQLRRAAAALGELADDRRHHVVVERVELASRELGRRLQRKGLFRDDLTPVPRVGVARQPVDVDLGQVADHRDAAAHIAVERRVAERDLGLVAARNQQRAGVVRLGHHQQAADARVQVLARQAARDRVRVLLERALDLVVDRRDRNDAVATPSARRSRSAIDRVASVLYCDGRL